MLAAIICTGPDLLVAAAICTGPDLLAATDDEAYDSAACARFVIACCRRSNGVHSSWLNCYGIPIGCPVSVCPPWVHAER